tara:strand:- start:788 stop:1972 length:1185 start_codon:yes stop_codon:yes gene_type:complete
MNLPQRGVPLKAHPPLKWPELEEEEEAGGAFLTQFGGAGDDENEAASGGLRTTGGGSAMAMSFDTKSATQIRLEKEMKLLHWHKLANASAMKAAIIRTKKLKKKDRAALKKSGRPGGNRELKAMTAQIEQEELSKPLRVGLEFKQRFDRIEAAEESRRDLEVERHVKSLKRLKVKLQAQEDMHARKRTYKAKRSAFIASLSRADLLMIGLNPDKVLTNGGGKKGGGTSDLAASAVDATPAPNAELTTMTTTLDRLMELEARIVSLERGAVFADNDDGAMLGIGDGGPAGAGGGETMPKRTNFRQRHADTTLDSVGQTYFSVSQKRRKPRKLVHTRNLSPGKGSTRRGKSGKSALSSAGRNALAQTLGDGRKGKSARRKKRGSGSGGGHAATARR